MSAGSSWSAVEILSFTKILRKKYNQAFWSQITKLECYQSAKDNIFKECVSIIKFIDVIISHLHKTRDYTIDNLAECYVSLISDFNHLISLDSKLHAFSLSHFEHLECFDCSIDDSGNFNFYLNSSMLIDLHSNGVKYRTASNARKKKTKNIDEGKASASVKTKNLNHDKHSVPVSSVSAKSLKVNTETPPEFTSKYGFKYFYDINSESDKTKRKQESEKLSKTLKKNMSDNSKGMSESKYVNPDKNETKAVVVSVTDAIIPVSNKFDALMEYDDSSPVTNNTHNANPCNLNIGKVNVGTKRAFSIDSNSGSDSGKGKQDLNTVKSNKIVKKTFVESIETNACKNDNIKTAIVENKTTIEDKCRNPENLASHISNFFENRLGQLAETNASEGVRADSEHIEASLDVDFNSDLLTNNAFTNEFISNDKTNLELNVSGSRVLNCDIPNDEVEILEDDGQSVEMENLDCGSVDAIESQKTVAEAFAVENSRDITGGSMSSTPIKTVSNKKLPISISCKHNDNPNRILRELSELLNREIIGRLENEFVKILLFEQNEHARAIEYLRNTNVFFHTVSSKKDKPFKVIIKGLPTDFGINELKIQLSDHGFNIISLYQFRRKNPEMPLPIYTVTLKNTDFDRKIMDLKVIGYLRVKIEHYRSNRTLQCFRCQRWGHPSSQCDMPPRCLKCAGDHLTNICDRKRTEKPTCVNCGLEHPANYSNCVAKPVTITKARARTEKAKSDINSETVTGNTIGGTNVVIIDVTAGETTTYAGVAAQTTKSTDKNQTKPKTLETDFIPRPILLENSKTFNQTENNSTGKIPEGGDKADFKDFTDIFRFFRDLKNSGILNIDSIFNFISSVKNVLESDADPLSKVIKIFQMILDLM